MNDENTFGVRCAECAYCERYLLEPTVIGCFCAELGCEIGAHETVGACAYFDPVDITSQAPAHVAAAAATATASVMEKVDAK